MNFISFTFYPFPYDFRVDSFRYTYIRSPFDKFNLYIRKYLRFFENPVYRVILNYFLGIFLGPKQTNMYVIHVTIYMIS